MLEGTRPRHALYPDRETEQLVNGVVEMSYRESAEKVSTMTVWNVIQSLGSEVCKEEEELVTAHKNKQLQGNKEVPVLFEEADGVYLRLQGRDRQISQKGKAEIFRSQKLYK